MSSTFIQVAGGVGRKIVTAAALTLIGIIVGFACALLPPAIPFAIVGLATGLLFWTLPELERVPLSWSRRVIPAVIFVYTCIPVYYAIILPGIPWIQIRRAALILWLIPFIITVSGSAQARSRIYNVLSASFPLSLCTVGFFSITIFTLLTSIHPLISLNYVFNSFLNWYIPMFAVILCVRDADLIVRIFRISIIAVAVNLVVGIIESYLHHPFLVYLLPAWMRDQIFSSNPIAAAALILGQGMRAGAYRASSTFTTSLSWGENCAMIAPFCLHFFAHGSRARDRWLGVAGFAMCLLSIILSGSRGAYIGMMAATVSFSIAWSFRAAITNKANLVGQFALILYSMAAGGALLAVLFVGRVHRAVFGGGEGQASTEARYAQWALAKPKILARPLSGYGAGSAGDVIHFPSSWGGFTVDGFYMNLLVDYGVPGFFLFFSAFLLAAALCFKAYAVDVSKTGAFGNAFGASILAFAIYRTTLSQTDSLTSAFMLLGLSYVYLHLVRNTREASTAAAGLRAASVDTR